MRRFALLVSAGLLVGCAAGDGAVALKLRCDGNGSISGITGYLVKVDLAGAHAEVTFPAGGATSLPPERTLPLIFDKSHTGTATFNVEARGSGGKVLGVGMSSVQVTASQAAALTVSLNCGTIGGDGGSDGGDLSVFDLPLGDLPPDLRIVDLAGVDSPIRDLAIPPDLAIPMECASDLDCKDPLKSRCYLPMGAASHCVQCQPKNDNCPMGFFCDMPNPGVFACTRGCMQDIDCRLDGGKPGWLCCNHGCVDPASNSTNCGMCGKSCNGMSCCNSACVDTGTDIANCGGCAMPCIAVPNAMPSCAAGACVPKCIGTYADCDGKYLTGCEIDTATNPINCGMCGMPCGLVAGGNPVCAMGKCKTLCSAPNLDCDNLYGNGCEVDSSKDVANCGACKMACAAAPNSMPSCAGGMCTLVCNTTFKDCNATYMDGCEIDTSNDAKNCGACKMACPVVGNDTVVCMAGACKVTLCAGTLADCDGAVANGCEIDTSKDVNNCGACKMVCGAKANSSPSCVTSKCKAVCTPNSGYLDCNLLPDDGCEINSANDVNNCGSCLHACNLSERCVAGGCMKDKVLVIGTDNLNLLSVQTTLVNVTTTPDNSRAFKSVAVCNAGLNDCTNFISNAKYDTVLVFSDGVFMATNPPIGDHLADFFDAGGRVVLAPQADGAIPFTGRFFGANYHLIQAGNAGKTLLNGVKLGTKHLMVPGANSLLQDVTTAGVNGAMNVSGGPFPFNGGASVADWNDNATTPMIVSGSIKDVHGVSRPRCDLNFYPVSTSWTGDGDKILRNALVYGF